MKKFLASGLLLCLACSGQFACASKKAKQTDIELAEIAQRNQVVMPLIDQALHLSDFPNMAPRADLRNKLESVSDFIQRAPEDGEPAT